MEETKQEDIHPYQKSNKFDKALFNWVYFYNEYIREATFTQKAHPKLPRYFKTKYHSIKLKMALSLEQKHIFLNALFKTHKKNFLTLFGLSFSESLAYTISLLFCAKFVKKFSSEQEKWGEVKDQLKISMLALFCIIFYVASRFFAAIYDFQGRIIALKCQNSISSILFQKLLKISLLNQKLVSELNLSTQIIHEPKTLDDLFKSSLKVVRAFFKLNCLGSLGYYLSGDRFGYLPIMSFLFSIPVYCIFKKWAQYESMEQSYTNERLTLVRSVFDNIFFVKSRALELFYFLKISKLRLREGILTIKKLSLEVSLCLIQHTFFFGGLITFIFILLEKKNFLKIENLAPFLIVIFKLRDSFNTIIINLPKIQEAKVILYRLGKFLQLKEIEKEKMNRSRINSSDVAIYLRDADFYWMEEGAVLETDADVRKKKKSVLQRSKTIFQMGKSPHEEPLLLDAIEMDDFNCRQSFQLSKLSFEVKKGEIVMIIGKTGTGKSSLLKGLLGEMGIDSILNLSLQGKFLYLDQDPWIIAGTIKKNITLDKEFEHELFQKTLELVGLQEEINKFELLEETFIVDAETELTDMQRRQISVARCFYQK